MKWITGIRAALFLLWLVPQTLHAKEIKMLFWYPGEAGSTAEAEPILTPFFQYLNQKLAPDTASGKYFSAIPDRLTYLKRESPVVGVVSYATWVQNASRIAGATVIMSTLPLPHGKPTEQYALVGKKEDLQKEKVLIFSSEPLPSQWVNTELFPSLSTSVDTMKSTPQIIAKLKEIGEGKLRALAILTPPEATTLAKIAAPWAKAIKMLARSKEVPTARVVLFDQHFSGASKLKAALLGAGNDPKAREILTEMRLKGFAPIP